jgi:hypothetical protein
VYTPLFAPVAVPIVLGLIKEILGWRRRRRARRDAELAAGSGQPVGADQVEEKVPITKASEIALAPVIEVKETSTRETPPARSLRSRKKITE